MTEAPAHPGPRDLRNLDLNLLVVLDAVIEAQSVTGAAGLLGVSQPAVSTSLGKLRRHFGDEILYRSGNRSHLTPFAVGMAARVKAALSGVERVFGSRGTLDASAITREFTVLLSDYAITVLGGAVTALMAQRAPAARLRLMPSTPDIVSRAEQVLTSHDVILLPHGFVTDLPSVDLFSDTWALVVDARHPLVGVGAGIEDLRTADWVLIYHGQTASTPAARELRTLGIEPRPTVITETFSTVRALVVGSHRIAMIPRRLLDAPGAGEGLVVLTSPLELNPMVEAMWWHPIYTYEPEHRFIRQVIVDAAATIMPVLDHART